jgi:hypothetical protein
MTVKDWIERLSEFPPHWQVQVATPAGGPIAIEHREIYGNPVVAVFGSNGGRFGENPLTEAEYKKQSQNFIRKMNNGYIHTTIHGDHRLYRPTGRINDTCYGEHFDERVINRMHADGLLQDNYQPTQHAALQGEDA